MIWRLRLNTAHNRKRNQIENWKIRYRTLLRMNLLVYFPFICEIMIPLYPFAHSQRKNCRPQPKHMTEKCETIFIQMQSLTHLMSSNWFLPVVFFSRLFHFSDDNNQEIAQLQRCRLLTVKTTRTTRRKNCPRALEMKRKRSNWIFWNQVFWLCRQSMKRSWRRLSQETKIDFWIRFSVQLKLHRRRYPIRSFDARRRKMMMMTGNWCRQMAAGDGWFCSVRRWWIYWSREWSKVSAYCLANFKKLLMLRNRQLRGLLRFAIFCTVH